MSGRRESRRSETQKRDQREKESDRDRGMRGRNYEPRDSAVSSNTVIPRKSKKDSEPKRAPSIEPNRPKKPPRKPRPKTPSPSPTPPPPPPPLPPPDPPSQPNYQSTSTSTSYNNYDEAIPLLTNLSPPTCDVGNENPRALGLEPRDASTTPQTIKIRINDSHNLVEVAIDLTAEDSFISEQFSKRLRIQPEVTSHKRTYPNPSGAMLTSKTRIKATITYGERSLDNRSLYVVADKLGHKIILGKVHWTALQPRATAFPPDARMGGQYLSNYSQLPQAMSSLTTGGTAASTTSSSYYPLPVQVAYVPAATYASGTDQSAAVSQQIQPALTPYSTFATQSSHQMQSSSPRSREYTSSISQYTPYVSDSSSYSIHTAQGHQMPYTSMPESPYLAPSIPYESSYVSQDPSDEHYTLQSNVSPPCQPSPQETQWASGHTTSPNEVHRTAEYSQDEVQNGKETALNYLSHGQPVNASHKRFPQDKTQRQSETPYDQPEQQLSKRDDFYATVPQWKYDH